MSRVLVVSRSYITGYSGLIPSDDSNFLERVDGVKRFIDRCDAEESDTEMQIIACAVITTSGGLYHVFESAPTDAYDNYGPVSLIVGGHIDERNSSDEFCTLSNLAEESLRREIHEEIGRVPEITKLAGFLIDRSSLKNSRHIGMLYRAEINGPVSPVSATEFRLDSEIAGTYTAEGMKELRDRMDPWSRIVTDSL